jgi:DNA-binding GntR family transcriptional regulator
VATPLSPPKLERRRSSAEDAASYISRLIFDGELRPGSRIVQEQIAELLGMSKVPVREALVALERDGWVTLEQYRGAFVNPITREGIAEHYRELAATILNYLLRRAAIRQNPSVIASLRRIADAFASAGEPADVFDVNQELNAVLISDMADPPRARMLLRTLQASAFVPGNTYELIPATADVPKRFFTAIADAVEVCDFEALEREVALMTAEITEMVVRHFVDCGVIEH